MTGGNVDVLRRVVEVYGSGTVVVATRGNNNVRRTMGSRARARFEKVRDDLRNFGLR